jgi:hypothetical protein
VVEAFRNEAVAWFMSGRTAIGVITCAFLALLSWSGSGWCGEAGPAASPAPATGDSSAAEPDSIRTAAADSATAEQELPSHVAVGDSLSVDPFIPVWKSFISADDSDVSIGSEMQVASLPGSDWAMKSVLRVEKKVYRARDMEDVSEQLTNNAITERPGLYRVMIMIGETYSKKKTLGLARYGKDLVFDTKSAVVNASYTKPLIGASSSQIAFRGDARGGKQDFKYDKSLSGGLSGLFTYGLGGLLQFKAGGGVSYMRETSEIGSIVFAGLPSRSDTVRVAAEYGRETRKLLTVGYERSSGVERRVTPPRGSSLEILDDPSLAQEEEARLNAEKLEINSYMKLFPYLSVSVDFGHELSSRRQRVDTRLSKETETTNIKATTEYRFSESGRMSITASTKEKMDDYGPLSLSSFTEKEKKVLLRAKQDITDSLSVNLSGSATLRQRFFKKREANPRDADYLRYQIEGNVNASPHPRIRANIGGVAIRNETINIDRTLSGDNRVDYQYRVGPKIQLRPSDWLDLSQEYMIRIEYTDFVYKENENYLDRTTTMITNANIKVLRPLSLNIRHVYLMRDSGSYLLRDGIRKYNRDGENFEYGLFFRAQYRAMINLDFSVEADFRTQENNRLGFQEGKKVVVSSIIYDSGGLKLGVARRRTFWGNGKIDLDINYVRRFGPYLSVERREYWIVNSSIAYTF